MDRLPGMVVELEAKISKLEAGLARAQRANSNAADQMQRRARQSADRIDQTYGSMTDRVAARFTRMGAAAARALPAIGALAAAGTAAAGTLAGVARGIAETGDAAARAGIGFEAYQALGYVAQQNRVGVDALVDGLKELNLRADEFVVTGSGSAAEAFRRLGFDAADLKRRLEDPVELFAEIVGRMEDLDRAAQIRVADEVFGGTGGEQFVQLLAAGEANLRETMQRARDLGLVLDTDVLSRAQEVDRKFGEIRARASALAKTLVVEVAGAIETAFSGESLRQMIADFEQLDRVLADLDGVQHGTLLSEGATAAVRDLEAAQAGLVQQADELARALDNVALELGIAGYGDAALDVEQLARQMESTASAFQTGAIDAETFRSEIEATTTAAGDTVTALGEIDGVDLSGIVARVGALVGALSQAAAQARQTRAEIAAAASAQAAPAGPKTYSGRGNIDPRVIMDGRNGPIAPGEVIRPELPSVNASFGIPDPETPSRSGGGGSGGGGGGGGGSSRKRLDEYQREVASIRERTAELKLEAVALAAVAVTHRDLSAAIDDAAAKAQLLANAQRAGRADTPQLRAEIDQLVQSQRTATDAADGLRERLEGVADARDQLTSAAQGAFEGLIRGTLSWRDALSQVVSTLADMALSRGFEAIFNGVGKGAAGGGGGFLGFLGGLLGFAGGGYTGHGGRYEPAGVVHRGEYVLSKPAVQRIGVPALEGLHSAALRGFAAGGLVGAMPALARPAQAAARVGDAAPVVTINSPITVNAAGGTPEQNTDLAKRISKEMEQGMRAVVADEIRRATRPGGVLNRG